MSHFHLQYFPRAGVPTTNFGASFLSEMEALHSAGLANATRGEETGYYTIESCYRSACRPKPLLEESSGGPTTAAPPRVRFERVPGKLS